jgi:hypothetical protein
VYLSDRLVILALFLNGLRDGLLPHLIDFKDVFFELGGELLYLLFIFTLHDQKGSFGAALQGLHDHVAVPGELVILQFPRLLQVEVKVFIFYELRLQVFVGLGLSLKHVLRLLILLLDLAPSILSIFICI